MVSEVLTSVADFGCIVTCSPYDWLFAKGTIASISYSLPDTSIALLIDGDIDTKSCEAAYKVQRISKSSIPDSWLREFSFGWGVTKMNAIWYSPFERYLHLDADTIVWGDVRKKSNLQNDFIWSINAFEMAEDAHGHANRWYFSPELLDQFDSHFQWRDYLANFSCTGTYFMSRGKLSLQRYKEFVLFGNRFPGAFKFGEMGILNLMVFEAVAEGKATIGYADFQTIFPDHPRNQLEARFAFDGGGYPVFRDGDEQILHMPDKKPLIDNAECYSWPMTYFRLKYLKDTEGIEGEEALKQLRKEDLEYHALRRRFLRREKLDKFWKLATGDRGLWRHLLSKLVRS